MLFEPITALLILVLHGCVAVGLHGGPLRTHGVCLSCSISQLAGSVKEHWASAGIRGGDSNWSSAFSGEGLSLIQTLVNRLMIIG